MGSDLCPPTAGQEEILSLTATGVVLEGVMLSEVNQGKANTI